MTAASGTLPPPYPAAAASATVRPGSTLHFRYLAEGGLWFDDETVTAPEGEDVSITV